MVQVLEMEEQAISSIEKALNAASRAGVYNIQDSAIIFESLEIIKQMYYNTLTKNSVLTVSEKETKTKTK